MKWLTDYMYTLMLIDHTHRSQRKVDMLHTDPSQQPKMKYIVNCALTLRSSTEKTPTIYKGNILNFPYFAGTEPGLVWFGLVWFGLVWFGLVWFGLVFLMQRWSYIFLSQKKDICSIFL